MKKCNETYNIVCLKWGNKYPAEYVNRLHRMIKKHTNLSFEFYCMTDDASGFYPEINVLPIEDDADVFGWWYKLELFKSDFYGLKGVTLFLDLDVVLVNNIDEMLTMHPGEFCIIKDQKKGNVYNSSVFRLELGSMGYVWDEFIRNKNSIVNRMHGDQDWISESVKNARLWPDGMVVSFKKECDSRVKRSFGVVGKKFRSWGHFLPKNESTFPENSKIVYFHGKPDPDDVAYSSYDMWRYSSWILDEWK